MPPGEKHLSSSSFDTNFFCCCFIASWRLAHRLCFIISNMRTVLLPPSPSSHVLWHANTQPALQWAAVYFLRLATLFGRIGLNATHLLLIQNHRKEPGRKWGLEKKNRTTKNHRPKVEAETRTGQDAASLCPCRSSIRENKLFRWVAGRWFTAKTSALIPLWVPVNIYLTVVRILTCIETGRGSFQHPLRPWWFVLSGHTHRKTKKNNQFWACTMQLNIFLHFDMAAANL